MKVPSSFIINLLVGLYFILSKVLRDWYKEVDFVYALIWFDRDKLFIRVYLEFI